MAVAAFIASVYIACLLAYTTGAGGLLAAYASLADHFAIFTASWLSAAALWR